MKTGLRAERHRQEEKARYHRDPERYSHEHRMRLYGLTPNEYMAMLLVQNGVCAICHRPETATYRGKLKALAVDHDHVTLRVRGLLCSACNRMIGVSGDDPDVLISAAEYLKGH